MEPLLYYDCRWQKNDDGYTVCGVCMEKVECQAICRTCFVQDVKKRKKDILVVRIVKDAMNKKSEQLFDLFVAQHEQNEGYEGD